MNLSLTSSTENRVKSQPSATQFVTMCRIVSLRGCSGFVTAANTSIKFQGPPQSSNGSAPSPAMHRG